MPAETAKDQELNVHGVHVSRYEIYGHYGDDTVRWYDPGGSNQLL